MVIGASLSMATDAVEPEAVTYTNVRNEAQSELPGGYTYFRGTTVFFTNCIALDANGDTQGLDGVEVELRVGTTISTPDIYTATVYAVEGVTNVWYQSITVPTNITVAYIQTKLTDANTNIYIYPWKTMRTAAPL